MRSKQQDSFFKQQITIDGKPVSAEEAEKKGINVNNQNEPLITGNVTESVSINQQFIGRKFKGNVDDLIRSLKQKDESTDNSSPTF